MSNVAARLILRYGKTDRPAYDLTDRPITLGREAINDVVLADPEISRRHARIFYQDETFLLEDLGSTNGTFINGRRVYAPTILQDEDVVEFGESIRMQFLVGERDELMPPPAQIIDLPTRPLTERPGPTKPLSGEPAPYAPPPSDTDLLALPELGDQPSSWRRPLFGCGCLFLIVIFICAITVFILDAQFPNVLYCGPLQSFFELFVTLTCPIP
ncbi:MAG: FHA domain-containing protein [Anaerolineae bacterium]|nr:FHA domain-containing protein [Anaerolineae bacterium]